MCVGSVGGWRGRGFLWAAGRRATQHLPHSLHPPPPSPQVIKNMGSTLGACGDVNRNVMAPPAPYTNRPDYVAAQARSKGGVGAGGRAAACPGRGTPTPLVPGLAHGRARKAGPHTLTPPPLTHTLSTGAGQRPGRPAGPPVWGLL